MTTYVSKLSGPTITITGKLIGAQTGHTTGTNTDNAISHTVTVSGTTVTGVDGWSNNKSSIPTFYVAAGDSVSVAITAPTTFSDKNNATLSLTNTTYEDASAERTFVGKAKQHDDQTLILMKVN